eukprot:Opistho-2@2973
MAYDLLPIENDVYKYVVEINGRLANKEVILSEKDTLWPTIRHLHIADTIREVTTGFKQFTAKSKALKMKGEKITAAELSEALKEMPQHQEEMQKYSLHVNMTEKCMDYYASLFLESVARVEQDMVMGEDSEGTKIKNHITNIVPILQDPKITIENKLRVLMVYVIIKNGLADADLQKVLDHAQIPADERAAIENLKQLGVQVSTSQSEKKKKAFKRRDRNMDGVYSLSRWTPLMKDILEDVCEERLDKDDFPYVREADAGASAEVAASGDAGAQSVRSSKPGWANKAKEKKEGKDASPWKVEAKAGPKIIVFVLGGVTYSELRVAYEVMRSRQREVVIGSTHLLTPKRFVADLQSLDKPLSDVNPDHVGISIGN